VTLLPDGRVVSSGYDDRVLIRDLLGTSVLAVQLGCSAIHLAAGTLPKNA
jgi:hypothetical protein